jgi:hypothetical protein
METLIAVLCFVLSLAGYDPGATHFIERSTRDGVDLLDSRIDVRPGIARFRCVRSASGACHYTLFPRDCRGRGTSSTGADVDCQAHPLRRFAVIAGDEREFSGLPRFQPCVAPQPDVPAVQCARR